MVTSNLWSSINPARYKQTSFQSQNSTSLVLKNVQIFLHQWTNCPSATISLFKTTNSTQQNWIFLYQWTFYDLNLICLVQKPAWNCHITSFVSIQQRPSFNIFVLFHTFDTTMEENAQPVYSLLKSRTWILTSSVALQFYFESSLIKDCIIHLILWLSFYDFIINTLTYLFKTAI